MNVLDNIAEGIVNAEKELYAFSEARRKRRWYAYSIFLLFAQIFITIFILLFQTSNNTVNFFNAIFLAFSSSAIISLLLLFDFSLLYKRYFRNPRTFWKPCLIQTLVVIVAILLSAVGFVVDLIIQFCALPYVGLVCSVIGFAQIAGSIIYLIVVSSKQKHYRYVTKSSRDSSVISDTEKPDTIRKILTRSISNNSISICFLDDQWNFDAGEALRFGFDKKSGCFVFVNKDAHQTIDYRNFIFLDYEDIILNKTSGTGGMLLGALIGGVSLGVVGAVVCGAEGRVASQARKIDRIIKLYYLDDHDTEQTLTFAQILTGEYVHGDGGIEKLKAIADNIQNEADEIVFRRKLRHKASKMDKEVYPYRPFVNDDWFSELQACIESIRSSRDDGYSVFRRTVIKEEHYLNNLTIQTVIQNMSKKLPDKSGVKHEIRILCGQDSIIAVGDGIKSEIKNTFSKRK